MHNSQESMALSSRELTLKQASATHELCNKEERHGDWDTTYSSEQ